MLKNLKYLAVLSLSFLMGCAGGKENDLDRLLLKGKVKSMTEYRYLAVESFGKLEKGEPFREEGWDQIIAFGENGMYDEVQYVTPEGDLVGRTVYQYNKDNQKIKEVEYDAEGGVSEKTTFTYNEDKKLYQILRQNSSDGIISSLMIDVFDGGRKVEHNYYGPNGAFFKREVMMMNRKGLAEETFIYQEDKKLVNHRKEEYNSNGQLKLLKIFSPEDNTLLYTVKCTYDSNGNVVLQEGIDNESGEEFLPIEYKYEFDEVGNWTRQIEYEAGEPKFIVERDFEYYQK